MDELEKKFLNFEALNILFSALQGQFAANNILKQVQHPEFKPEVLDSIKGHIQEVNQQLDRFKAGDLILQPDSLEESESEKQFFSVFNHLRQVFAHSANSIVHIASDKQWVENPQHYQLLVAYFAWYAYSRDNYYKKLKSFYQDNAHNDLLPQIDFKLQSINNDIQLVNTFLKSLKLPEGPEENFFPHLMFFIKTLPGYFYAKVHDCNQILSIKSAEFTYQMAGFKGELAEIWHKHNFSSGEAGYWIAYNFTPELSLKWKEKGFTVEDAADWHYAGFELEDALSWVRYMFTPILALQWKQGNFSPEHSAILISHGYFSPAVLPTDPKETDLLIEKGFAEPELKDRN